MSATATAVPDVAVESHGSVFLLRPNTPAAAEWLEQNCQSEGWQWFGQALAVEPRYVGAVVEGMMSDGLEVM